jgi:UDP-N-acetylglucosamine 2-epimerase (hydrolysing)
MKKIVFLTGTRADFGKIKPLISILEVHPEFEVFVFVTGYAFAGGIRLYFIRD